MEGTEGWRMTLLTNRQRDREINQKKQRNLLQITLASKHLPTQRFKKKKTTADSLTNLIDLILNQSLEHNFNKTLQSNLIPQNSK